MMPTPLAASGLSRADPRRHTEPGCDQSEEDEYRTGDEGITPADAEGDGGQRHDQHRLEHGDPESAQRFPGHQPGRRDRCGRLPGGHSQLPIFDQGGRGGEGGKEHEQNRLGESGGLDVGKATPDHGSHRFDGHRRLGYQPPGGSDCGLIGTDQGSLSSEHELLILDRYRLFQLCPKVNPHPAPGGHLDRFGGGFGEDHRKSCHGVTDGPQRILFAVEADDPVRFEVSHHPGPDVGVATDHGQFGIDA